MRNFAFILLLIPGTLLAQQPSAAARKSAESPAVVAGVPPAAVTAMRSIDAERIRAHVKFLSHDLLEGRGTGQRGGDIAAEYIAAQFQLAGLEPAGENGSYMQKVALMGVTTQPQTTFSMVPQGAQPMQLTLRDDYVVTDETLSESADIDAEMIFVGYGIAAPEYGWDDYKGADVKGKVLLMLVNEPPSTDEKFFKGAALTYYGRWTYKYEEAARRGAAGAVIIHRTDMASYGWDVVRNSWSGERSYIKEDAPAVKAASWIQLEVARKALSAVGQDLDRLFEAAKSRDFQPVPLPIRVQAKVVSALRPFTSNNVLARLAGSRPKARQQAVIYSSHYDHLGIRPGTSGDDIYNGAADNATGTALLIELGRAFASSRVRPPRSLLFAAVTAEEQGLRGSEFLGKNPPVPAGQITLNLNYDNIQPWGRPEEVEVVGAERTSFYPTVQKTAKEFGLEIKPDSNPSAGYYYRSDHFSMARVGVPAFSVSEGQKFRGKSAEWGAQQAAEYTAQRYHQPGDEYNEQMDFTSSEVLAEFGFVLGWRAATMPRLVIWQPGDEFEAARKQGQGKP
jgi:Zn-dependent M28 family amino/carboxypeptidase